MIKACTPDERLVSLCSEEKFEEVFGEFKKKIADVFFKEYQISKIIEDINFLLDCLFDEKTDKIIIEYLLVFFFSHLYKEETYSFFTNLISKIFNIHKDAQLIYISKNTLIEEDFISSLYIFVKEKSYLINDLISFFLMNQLTTSPIKKIMKDFPNVRWELTDRTWNEIINGKNISKFEKFQTIDKMLKSIRDTDTDNNAKKNIKQFLRKSLGNFHNNNHLIQITSIKELMNYCLDQKFQYILRLFFKYKYQSVFSKDLIIKAFDTKCNNFLIKVFHKKIEEKIFFKMEIFDKIISYLEEESTFLFGIFFLINLKAKINYWNTKHHLKVIDFLETFLTTDRINHLLNVPNPLQVLIALINFLYKLANFNSPFHLKYLNIAKKFKRLALMTIESVENNLFYCKFMFFQIYFPLKQSLFEMMLAHKDFFAEILQKDAFYQSISKLMKSQHHHDHDFFIVSNSYTILKKNYIYDKVNLSLYVSTNEDETKLEKISKRRFEFTHNLLSNSNIKSEKFYRKINVFRFLKFPSLESATKINHIYQYKIFIKSIKSRVFMELFFYLLIFLFLYAEISMVLIIFNDTSSFVDDFSNLLFNRKVDSKYLITDSNYTSNLTYHDYSSIFNPTNNDLKSGCLMNVFDLLGSNQKNVNMTLFLTNTIDECAKKMEIKINYDDQVIYITCSLIISMLYGIQLFLEKLYEYKLYREIKFRMHNLNDIILFITSYLCIYLVQNFYTYPIDLLQTLFLIIRSGFVIIAANLWIKFLFFANLTSTFGILIKIIRNMFQDLLKFTVLFLYVLLYFCSFSYFFFFSLNENATITYTFINMVGVAFGNFNFYYDSDYEKITYSFFIIIFLFVLNIVFFNLLIAMISQTYSNLINQSKMEYGIILYDLYTIKKYDKTFGALNLFPPPVSFILFLPSLILAITKNRKINEILIKLGYSLCLFTFTLYFIFMHIFFIPLAWVKVFFLILLRRYKLNKVYLKVPYLIIFFHILIWCCFGIIFLIFRFIFFDITTFIKSAWCFKSNKIKFEEISECHLKLLYSMLKKLDHENVKEMQYEKFQEQYSIYVLNSDIKKVKKIFKNYDDIEKSLKKIQDALHFIKKLSLNSKIKITLSKDLIKSSKFYLKKRYRMNSLKSLYLINLDENYRNFQYYQQESLHGRKKEF